MEKGSEKVEKGKKTDAQNGHVFMDPFKKKKTTIVNYAIKNKIFIDANFTTYQ